MPLLLQLTYDGTDLHGTTAAQGGRSLLGELRAALARLGCEDAVVEVLSRTDAGVHARGQVAVVEGVADRPLDAWWRGLAHQLPDDVRCAAVAWVASTPTVHGKTYRYVVDPGVVGDPFRARFAWRVPLDAARLLPLASLLEGTHDFEAFRRRGETRERLVRTVTSASWRLEGDLVVFEIAADGFVYRLVRSLVGAMVEVARGVSTPDDLRAALAGVPQGLSRQQAPARGLCLERILLDPVPSWYRGPMDQSAS